MSLLLYTSAAGFCLARVNDQERLEQVDDLITHFAKPSRFEESIQLVAFKKFKDIKKGIKALQAVQDHTVPKSLKKFVKKHVVQAGLDTLIVDDKQLGHDLHKSLGITCIYASQLQELYRGISSQINALTGIDEHTSHRMRLGLAHSLSRHKIRFAPEKIDSSVIQAVHTLDDLNKEVNTLSMRLKEWYGAHFPDLSKIVVDMLTYARLVKLIGLSKNAQEADLESVVSAEVADQIRRAAITNIGAEITEIDLITILRFAQVLINLLSSRTRLEEYVKNRIVALCPNTCHLVGELLAARLMAHAGSLMSLAKQPASTVQIYGAEKAFFRSVKSRDSKTPKFGLLYHAQLVSQAHGRVKARMSRMVACQTALCARVDAFSEGTLEGPSVAIAAKEKLLRRMQSMEAAEESRSAGGRFNRNQRSEPRGRSGHHYDQSHDVQPGPPRKMSRRF